MSARVDKLLPNGLFLRFLDYFSGTADRFHLARVPYSDDKIQSSFKQNQKVRYVRAHAHCDGVLVLGAPYLSVAVFRCYFQCLAQVLVLYLHLFCACSFLQSALLSARVLYVDYANKQVGLTLKPHLVQWRALDFSSLRLGETIEHARVQFILPGLGMILQLKKTAASSEESESAGNGKTEEGTQKGEQDTSLSGFVHISNVSDQRVEKLEKKYKVRARLALPLSHSLCNV